MNIKDVYLHGNANIVKNITFGTGTGTNAGKLVATITWAKEGAEDTIRTIDITGSHLGNQAANKVFAGPSSGNNAAPTFRSLVAADIPEISATKITSGTLEAARLSWASNSAKGAIQLGEAQDSSAVTITSTASTSDQNYYIRLNNNGIAYVHVPWISETGIKLDTVTGTKIEDTTVIKTISNTGLSIEGGTDLFKIGDGTNYIEVPIATSNTSHNHDSTYTKKTQAIPYIVGPTTDTTEGQWTGSYSGITAYEEGLTIIYVPAVGGASNTKLNINELGEVPCYYSGTSKLTTHFAAGTPIMFTYRTIGTTAGWRRADYNSNSDTYPSALCTTAATTAAKTASCTYYYARANSFIHVNIRYTNTVEGAITLNINSQGAKPIYINGEASSASNYSLSSGSYLAYYDGTNYYFRTDGKLTVNGLINTSGSSIYLPLSGGTMTGPITCGTTASADSLDQGINFGSVSSMVAHTGTSTGLGLYSKGPIWIRPGNGSIGVSYGLVVDYNSITYNGNTIYHSGNIPSNSSSAAGIVAAPSAAGMVYMTVAGANNTYSPQWTTIDTTVTSNSTHLVTSGAVHTAIAESVASAVQYLGTVNSASAVTGKTTAGYGDFVRVTEEFTINSVTAHVGDILYLNSSAANAYSTASNWVVAHTEVDTNTWTAASTTAAGYIPILAASNTALASSDNDYILAFVNGTNTSPVWRKLPATAYSDTWTAWVGATSSANGTAGYMPAAAIADREKFLRGDGTWCELNNYTLPTATSSAIGGVMVGDTLTDVSGYTAVKIKDGKIYYHDTTYTFNVLQLANANNTVVGSYSPAGSSNTTTLKTGDNMFVSRIGNIVTLSALDEKVQCLGIAKPGKFQVVLRVDRSPDCTVTHYNDSLYLEIAERDVTLHCDNFQGTFMGNASSAENLNTSQRGFLYQTAASTTVGTGHGTRTTSTIGIPAITHTSTSNDTYSLLEDLFYLSSTTKYIGDNIHSVKFPNVLTSNGTTDDWTGSTTTGTTVTAPANNYTAGTGITISQEGVISTVAKEWYGTEAEFNALTTLDANTTYYIKES